MPTIIYLCELPSGAIELRRCAMPPLVGGTIFDVHPGEEAYGLSYDQLKAPAAEGMTLAIVERREFWVTGPVDGAVGDWPHNEPTTAVEATG